MNEIRVTLRSGLQINRFPVFCATVVGGTTGLRVPLTALFQSLDSKVHGGTSAKRTRNSRIAARFLAALLASAIGFRLLNRRTGVQRAAALGRSRSNSLTSDEDTPKRIRPRRTRVPPGLPPLPAVAITSKQPVVALGVPLAGKTIDLTLFLFTRAADVLVQSWLSLRPPKNRLMKWVTDHGSPLLFAASSATIMHAFFYAPSHLPYTYVKWIDRIAECDERLIEVLRQVYYGNFVYGRETGLSPLLGSMAKDLGMPEEWGDPTKTIPVKCEMVHHGVSKSCEIHALWRFYRAWKMAFGVYAPLQGLILLRALSDRRANKSAAARKAVIDTARSSGFLGAFVALFYYGVCLSRTRLGPKVFDEKTVSKQMWDSGLCVDGGCLLCGWSVLLEFPKRQAELMLFVLPRALGVWVPRRYLRDQRWKEETVFAVSTAIVLTAVQESPDKVRGVFGKVLKQIVAV